MTHPLSTANLLALAATASDEPDHHHVTAAYHAARAHALICSDADGYTLPDADCDLAADVAALEMAHAAAASLARRLYDRTQDRPELADWLFRITCHYVRAGENLAGDLEHTADALTVTP